MNSIPDWRFRAPGGLSLAEALLRYSPSTTGSSNAERPRADLLRILRPQAAVRWRGARVSMLTPQRVEFTLAHGLAGDLISQWELFDLMEETWPRLAKNLAELKRAVIAMNWRVEPWSEQNQPPTPEAEERARLVTHALWRMRPEPAADESEFRGLLRDLLDAWGKGISVVELLWEMRQTAEFGQVILPRAAQWVHPVNYGVREDGSVGLRPGPGPEPGTRTGATAPDLVDLPAHKFLVAIAKARTTHWCGAALLRPLAWWWAAANFSAEWLLNYAQLFGVPLRWATYSSTADEATIAKIADMMSNLGSAAWAAFPEGTNLHLLEGQKQAGASPQEAILELADRNCDLLILGQTLTSDPGDRGTQALGAVHERIRGDVIQAAADWLAGILGQQLIPSILELNYGDSDFAPEIKAEPIRAQDQVANAQRVATLLNAGLELPRAWLYEHLDIPLPQSGEAVVGGPRLSGLGPMLQAAAGRMTPLAQPAPSDAIAAARARALAEAYRGALAPLREIILRSQSPEEALAEARRYFADWAPERVAALVEEALQVAAAAGAAEAVEAARQPRA